MNSQNFNSLVKHVHERTSKVMVHKRAEYSGDNDVFHNFNNSTGISLHKTNTACGWEFMVKHLQSIKDMIEDIEKNHDKQIPDKYTFAYLDEKFGDAANYLILIEGMIREKIAFKLAAQEKAVGIQQ